MTKLADVLTSWLTLAAVWPRWADMLAVFALLGLCAAALLLILALLIRSPAVGAAGIALATVGALAYGYTLGRFTYGMPATGGARWWDLVTIAGVLLWRLALYVREV
jgi:hypothetical protein